MTLEEKHPLTVGLKLWYMIPGKYPQIIPVEIKSITKVEERIVLGKVIPSMDSYNMECVNPKDAKNKWLPSLKWFKSVFFDTNYYYNVRIFFSLDDAISKRNEILNKELKKAEETFNKTKAKIEKLLKSK